MKGEGGGGWVAMVTGACALVYSMHTVGIKRCYLLITVKNPYKSHRSMIVN